MYQSSRSVSFLGSPSGCLYRHVISVMKILISLPLTANAQGFHGILKPKRECDFGTSVREGLYSAFT